MPYGSPLRQRDGPLFLDKRPCSDVPATTSNEQPAFGCAHTRTPHRTLFLGRRRTTRACGVHAPRRAGWIRSVFYGSSLRQRDGPLPRCTTVLRRASRGRQRAAGVRLCAHAIAPPHALSRNEAHHARLRRLRAAPRWFESVYALRKPTAPARRPSASVHGRFSTCWPRPPTSSRRSRVRTRERATARSLSGEGTPRALAALARCAALVGVSPCPMNAHCASETALSLGARPYSDV